MPLNYQGKLKEYAAIVGKAESSMYENRKAAEVLRHFNEKTRTFEISAEGKTRTFEFLDKPPTRELFMNSADRTRAELNGLLEHLERLANERLGITNEPEPAATPPGKTAKRMAEFDAMSDEKQIAKLLELFR
jgi:hypothetical protein